jgi:hypothetical protein
MSSRVVARTKAGGDKLRPYKSISSALLLDFGKELDEFLLARGLIVAAVRLG